MSPSPGRAAGRGLRPRDRRAIRLGLWVAVPVLVLVLGVGPYRTELGEARDQLAADRGLLSRERALLEAADLFDAERSAAESAVEGRSTRLFPGDATLAAGTLVRYVAEEADRSRVLLEGTETASPEPVAPGLTAVRIRLSGVSDVAGVLELLRRLEDGPRLVRIEQLLLERRDAYTVPGIEALGEDLQLVSLGATVVGYTLDAEAGG